jgi:hypothetical protein
MKSKITEYLFIFLILFIVLLPISYIGTSLIRQKILEKSIKDEIMQLEREIPKSEIMINKEFTKLNKNDRNQLLQFGWDKTYFIRSYYFLESDRFILKQSYNGIFFRLLDVYGKEHMLSQIEMISMASAAESAEYFDSSNENNSADKLNGYIIAWEKNGGKKDREWWKEFEGSEFYTRFLDEVFSEMENRGDFTLENTYRMIMSIDEGHNESLKNYIIGHYSVPIDQWVAEFAYNRYLADKMKGDYIAASIDSNIIYTTWGYWNGFKDTDISEILSILRNMPDSKFSDIYFDIIFIFISTMAFDLLFFLIWRKKIHNH